MGFWRALISCPIRFVSQIRRAKIAHATESAVVIASAVTVTVAVAVTGSVGAAVAADVDVVGAVVGAAVLAATVVDASTSTTGHDSISAVQAGISQASSVMLVTPVLKS